MSGFYEPPPAFTSPFRDRLRHPKWDLIAERLGRPAPGILQELYGRQDLVLRSHFCISPPDGGAELWLDLFFPMDEEALAPYGLSLPPGTLAFADDEHGDPYFYVPDATPVGDGPVYLMQRHRGGETVLPVAPSLAAFLEWERRQVS
jgi:hypothetical protein